MLTETVRTYTVTQDIIDKAIADNMHNYNVKRIESLINKKLTKEDISPFYALWMSQYVEVDPEDIDYWAKKNFIAALQYACDKLTPARLDWCAEQAYWYAIKYAHTKITPERLDWCVKQEPIIALEYASNKLTSERLEWCKLQTTLTPSTPSTFAFGGLGWGIKQLSSRYI